MTTVATRESVTLTRNENVKLTMLPNNGSYVYFLQLAYIVK